MLSYSLHRPLCRVVCIIVVDVNVTATEIIVALEAGQVKFTFLKVFMILRKALCT